MTQPDGSYVLTRDELTQLAWRSAGAALAYAGVPPEELGSCLLEIEPTIDEFVVQAEEARLTGLAQKVSE